MSMTMNTTIKRRILWLALAAFGIAALLFQILVFHADATATADGEPYSVSLHSPVTFPVDI